MTQKASLIVDIRALDNVTPSLKNIQSSVIRFVGAITASLVAVRGIAFPIQAAAEFEKELKNVQKTTGFTSSEIESLSEALNDMAGELISSQVELAQIAATAGQLGLGQQGVGAILSFTESVAKASATFDIAADSLSTLAAQIINVFGLSVTDDLENVFSTINEVSNNSVASAANLIDIIKRVGNVAELTVTDVTALAATTQDLGVTSEVAGTTLVKQFSRMQSEASKFAEVMSISTDEWVRRVEDNALTAFKDVLEQIGQLETAAKADAIKELFGGGRIFALASKQVTDAANGFEILDRNLQNATEAFIVGTSSLKEYEVIASSLSGQTDQLRNKWRELAIEAGNSLIPQLKEIVAELGELADSDSARAVFDSLAEGLSNVINFGRETLAVLLEWRLLWVNIIPLIKTFIGLRLAFALKTQVKGWLAAQEAMRQASKAGEAALTTWQLLVRQFESSRLGRAAQTAADGISKAFAGGASPEVSVASAAASQASRERVANNKVLTAEYKAQVAALNAQTNQLSLQNVQTKAQIAELQKSIAIKEATLASDKKLRNLTFEQIGLRRQAIQQEEKQIVVLQAELAARQRTLVTSSAQLGIARNMLATQTAINVAAAQEAVIRKATIPAGSGRFWETASKGAKDYSAAAVGARLASTGLLGTIKKLGGVLLRFLVGPLGTIALIASGIFLAFKTDILNFLGFTQDVEGVVAESRSKRRERESRKDARAAVEAYRAELDAAELGVDIETRLNSDDADVQSLAQEEVSKRIGVLENRLKGLNGEIELSKRRFDQWVPSLENIDDELAKANEKVEQQAKLWEFIQDSNVNQVSPTEQSVFDDLQAAKAEVLALDKERAELEKNQTAELKAQAEFTKAIAAADKERLRILRLQGTVNTNEEFEVLKAINTRNQALVRRANLRKQEEAQVAKLAALQNKLEEGGTRRSRQTATQLSRAIEDAKTDVANTQTLIQGADQTLANSRQQIEVLGGALKGNSKDWLAWALTQSEATTQLLVTENAAKRASGGLQDQSVRLTEQTPKVKELAEEYTQLQITLNNFNNSRIPIDAINASLKGIVDNIGSTIAATQNSVNGLLDDYRAAASNNRLDIELNTSIATDPELRRVAERAEERILDLQERQINALRRGDTLYAKILGRTIERVERESQITENARKAEIQAQQTREQIEATSARRAELEERAKAALEAQSIALANLTEVKKTSPIDSEAVKQAQVSLVAAQREVQAVVSAIDDAQKETAELGKEFVELAATQKLLGVTESGGLTSIIDAEEVKEVTGLVQEGVSSINRLYSNVAVEAGRAATETGTVLDRFAQRIKSLQEINAVKIGRVVSEEDLGNIRALSEAYASLASNALNARAIIESRGDLGKVLEDLNNLQSIAEKRAQEAAAKANVIVPLKIAVSEDPEVRDQFTEAVEKAASEAEIAPEVDAAAVEAKLEDANLVAPVKLVASGELQTEDGRSIQEVFNSTVEPVTQPVEFDAEGAAYFKSRELLQKQADGVPLYQGIELTPDQRSILRAQEQIDAERKKAGEEPINWTFKVDSTEIDRAVKKYENDDVEVGADITYDPPLSGAEGLFKGAQADVDTSGKTVSVPISANADQFASATQPELRKIKPLEVPIIGILDSVKGSLGSLAAATGGYIRGPGTTTSDSIPAWLSDKEYVVKASAVSHYGVDFMRSINNMDFSLPKFATGGLVDAQKFKLPKMPDIVLPKLSIGGAVSNDNRKVDNSSKSFSPFKLISSVTNKLNNALHSVANTSVSKSVSNTIQSSVSKAVDEALYDFGDVLNVDNSSTVTSSVSDAVYNALSSSSLSKVDGDAINNAISSSVTSMLVGGNVSKVSVDKSLVIQNIIEELHKSLSRYSSATRGGDVYAATGGYIRGPGTTKSDSIPAWLSDREYVVQAPAVAKYGVGFMQAINSMELDINSLMPKFNTGGLVQAQPQNYGVGLFDKLNSVTKSRLPKFATGGLVEAAGKVASSTVSTSEEVNVNIRMGGKQTSLRGEKQQVKNLVDMLNNIEAVR